MELSHYFNPVDFNRFKNENREFGNHLLGFEIEQNTGNLIDSDSYDVAIVGIPFDSKNTNGENEIKTPDEIRRQLYYLSNFERQLKVVDFGNIKSGKNKKANLLSLRDIVGYLIEKTVTILIIGGSQDFTVGICDAFRNEKYFSLSVVDALLDIKYEIEAFSSSNFLTRVFKNNPNIFQFSLLGYQRHLVPESFFDKTTGVCQHLRLGVLRENFVEIEPVLRNTDVLSFDFGAIKFSDAPGNWQKNPNGLRSEEACQIARYAGLSEMLKVFGLFETMFDEETGISTKLSAEIIWYFLDGISYKQAKSEWRTDDKVVYKVAIKELDKPVVFYHEPVTNRWWIEISSEKGDQKVIACSENEYLKASNNEISELWLEFVQKMDRLPK